MPLQIGVTGGIGSGKSVVCELFSCLGIPVYKADERAKWLTTNHPGIRGNVIALLGSEAYREDGSYHTSFVASRVFKDGNLLKQLNSIVHPVVMEDTLQWVRDHQDKPYLVKEAAIMNKAGDRNSLDYVVVVEAPVALRVQRILKRDHRAEAEIRAIIDRQATEEQRRLIADFTIVNDDVSALIPQVLALHRRFLQERN